ncbi:hypothetical protein ACWC0A_30630 [Streptomyces scopuliridis]
MNGLGPSGHCIVVADTPGPDGFAVVCTPHGPLGAWEGRTEAVLRAMEHDIENGGTSL